MSGLHLDIDEYNLIINVGIRIITAFIFLLFIIPLSIKEAGVKNGLKLLRYQLLASNVAIFLVNTIGLFIILFRFFLGTDAIKLVTDAITLFNSLGFLVVAVLSYQVYHQQYTPENKKRHELIEKLEEKEMRKAGDKK